MPTHRNRDGGWAFFYDVASLGRPAGNQAHQYHNNGNNYKNMNESARSEEHTSELQSLMRISYAVLCLKKKKIKNLQHTRQNTSEIIRDTENKNSITRQK